MSAFDPGRTLLAVLLAASAGVSVAAPEAVSETRRILDGCRRAAIPMGVRLECEGFWAQVADGSKGSPRRGAGVIRGLVEALGGEISFEGRSAVADGGAWDGRRFSFTVPDGQGGRVEGRGADVELPGAPERVAICATRRPVAASRCDAVLAVLASAGPAPWRVPSPPPTFLGRGVPVPVGCRTEAAAEVGFGISCDGGAALYVSRLKSASEVDAATNAMRDQFLQVPEASAAERVECRIGGAVTRCWVVRAGSGPAGASFIVGGAVPRGVPVLAQCIRPATMAGVPAVCEGVMTFGAGAAE